MDDNATPSRGTQSPIARVAALSAAAICLFVVENIWIDPWVVRRSHHRLPSFVPDPLGGTWALVLLALAVTLVLAVICQVFLMKDVTVVVWKKALTGAAVLAATLLVGQWFVATGGMTLWKQLHPPRRDHPVTLHWQASTSKNVRYNIYRGPSPGFHPQKINSVPVDGLTFVDTTAENHTTYFYVARAVDATGLESTDSNESRADIP